MESQWIQRRMLVADIINARPDNPIRAITIEGEGLKQMDYGFRRPGGKRNNWWEKGISQYWDVVKTSLPGALRYEAYNEERNLQIQHIKAAAARGIATRREQR